MNTQKKMGFPREVQGQRREIHTGRGCEAVDSTPVCKLLTESVWVSCVD